MDRGRIRTMVMIAVSAAVVCVLAPWAIPVGPVPISLCTLLICLTAWLLGWKGTVWTVLVYILAGAAGLPVFSGFAGGLGVLLGPTGGYIAGYLPLALICGWFVQRFPGSRRLQLVGLVLGTGVLYLLGTAWFCLQAGQSVRAALGLCVLPFLPGDGAKMAVVLTVGPVLRGRLSKAGLLEQNRNRYG